MFSKKKSTGPKYLGSCFAGQGFKIRSVNVWDYKWKHQKMQVEVVDPKDKRTLKFDLWSIKVEGREIEFIASEFSNGVWGFYEPESKSEP